MRCNKVYFCDKKIIIEKMRKKSNFTYIIELELTKHIYIYIYINLKNRNIKQTNWEEF